MDAATLEALSGLTADPQLSAAAEAITALLETMPAISDPSAQLEASNLMMAALYASTGATPESVEVDLGDGPMTGEKVSLNVTYDAAFAMLDAVLTGGSDSQKAYAQAALDLMNAIVQAGIPDAPAFASFGDLAAYIMEQDEEVASLSIPMDVTTVINDDCVYQEVLSTEELDGASANIYVSALQEGETMQSLMEMHISEGDALNGSIMASYSGDLSGNMNLLFDFSAATQSATVVTHTDGTEETSTSSADLGLSMLAMQTTDEAGLVNSNVTMDMRIGETDNDGASTGGTLSLIAQRVDTAGEDGSVTSGYYMNLIGGSGEEAEGEINFTLSFTVNEKQVPFADVFAGVELTALPAESTDAEGNTDPAYQQLQIDLMAPVADLMTLSAEESVMELISLFQIAVVEEGVLSAEIEVEGEADGYFITPDGSITTVEDGYLAEEVAVPEYVYDFSEEGAVLDLDAAAEIYGAEIPAVTPPEGYTLEYLYASEGYISMDYGTGETYFSVTAFPMYYDANDYKAMILNDDGSLSDIENTVANVCYNEDGTLSYADFIVGSNALTVYFDSATPETAQAILAGI